MKIIFFLSTPTPYFLDSIQRLNDVFSPGKLLVVYDPLHHYTGYSTLLKKYNYESIHINDLQKYGGLSSFLRRFNPDLIYIPGWINKRLFLTTMWSKYEFVLGMDTPYLGKLRQKIFVKLIFAIAGRKKIRKIWTAGTAKSMKYARMINPGARVLPGLYCATVEKFIKNGVKTEMHDPIRLLYCGRLSPEKNPQLLIEALKGTEGFELWVAGSGPMLPIINAQGFVRYTGNVSPDELPDIMKEVDFLVLPSIYDRWGVVVHEAASAGLPLLLSYEVGAREWFLLPNKNGFLFSPYHTRELISILKMIRHLDNEKFREMSLISKKLGTLYNQYMWAMNFASFLHN